MGRVKKQMWLVVAFHPNYAHFESVTVRAAKAEDAVIGACSKIPQSYVDEGDIHVWPLNAARRFTATRGFTVTERG